MAISGVGTDLVEISGVRRLRKNYGKRFLERVFHREELEYCLNRKEKDQCLAARFAAKESFAKALGMGIFNLPFKDVYVRSGKGGNPEMMVSGRALSLCDEKRIKKIHLSLSHEKEMAMAVVIMEGKE